MWAAVFGAESLAPFAPGRQACTRLRQSCGYMWSEAACVRHHRRMRRPSLASFWGPRLCRCA